MKNTAMVSILLGIAIAGCTRQALPSHQLAHSPERIGVAPAPEKIVPTEQIDAFLELAKTKDFHGMWWMGMKIFPEGTFIPDHVRRFNGYPTREPAPGQLAYEFFFVKGEGGAASITLFLERATGKVIMFSPVEAMF